jgi:hypothetical protein
MHFHSWTNYSAIKKYSDYKLYPSFRGCKFEKKSVAYIHMNTVTKWSNCCRKCIKGGEKVCNTEINFLEVWKSVIVFAIEHHLLLEK